MFLANGFRRVPRGILLLPDHAGSSERRAPIHLADAHRMSDDLDRSATLRFGIVIEPVLGEIDDDSLSRSGRQNMSAGNGEILARARQPGIDARIDSNQFLGA